MRGQECQGYNIGCDEEISYVTYYFTHPDCIEQVGAFLCQNCIQILHNSGAVVQEQKVEA